MAICYDHARIFTADGTHAECFVVENERFAFVGSSKDAARLFPNAQHVDLHDQFVCPGFNDSHMHLLNLGNMLTQAQLSPVTDSLSPVLAALAEYVHMHADDLFILGSSTAKASSM